MSDQTSVFDRRAVRLHRDRAAARVGAVADLLGDAADRLLDRLDDTTRRFASALDIGGRGVVAPRLRARGIATVSSDLSPAMAALNPGPVVVADEEWLPFAPGSFDLVVASLSLHWVNDLPGALIQIRRALRPDGLLLASVPALGSLGELRTALTEAEVALTGGAAPRVSPFPDLRDCAALLQLAGFALPVADVEEIRVLYAAARSAGGGGDECRGAAGSAGAAAGFVCGGFEWGGSVSGDVAVGGYDGVGAGGVGRISEASSAIFVAAPKLADDASLIRPTTADLRIWGFLDQCRPGRESKIEAASKRRERFAYPALRLDAGGVLIRLPMLADRIGPDFFPCAGG